MTEIFEGLATVELRAGDVELDGDKHPIPCEECTFVLEGGDLIEVRVTRQTRLGPPKKLRDAPWEELEDHPLAVGFDKAPGGHVEATLRGVVISEGDRIAIAGDIERSTSTDGYRGAGDSFVKAIDARWIGVGTDAVAWVVEQAREEEPEEKPRAKAEKEERTGPSLMPAQVLAVLAVLGLFAAAILWKYSAYAAPVLGYALLFGSLALFTWRRRSFLPRVLAIFPTGPLRPQDVHSPRSSFRLLWGLGGPGVPTTLMGFFLMMGAAIVILAEPSNGMGSLFLFGIVLVVVLIQLGFTFFQNRSPARLLGVIAKAKPAEGDGWGMREGEVLSGELSRWRTHTREESTSTESYTDSNGNVQTRQVTNRWYHGIEYGGKGTIRVRFGDREVQVDLRDKALWGTTRRVFRNLRLEESIRPGDRVVLVGRIEGTRAKLGGAESLILFGDPDDPMGALKQARIHHSVAIVGFVLAAATCIAIIVDALGG